MNQISVDFASLSQTQAHIASTAARMNAQLADLKSYLAPMVATWEGDAATTYQQLQATWDRSALALNDVLAGIGRAVTTAGDDFQATEQANRNRFAL